MKKKLNKLNYINRSSTTDLYNLAESIGLKNLIIIRKSELPLYIDKYENIILNLGDSTHWCVLNTKKKRYFDTYGQPPPLIVPKDYTYSKKKFEIQAIDGASSTMCGQACCVWLWYINNKSETAFYKEFKDIYKNI